MRGMAAPLCLVLARARRRPRRWLLPALGIALAAAFAGGVAAESQITADHAARAALAAVSPLDRMVRLTYNGTFSPAVVRQAQGLQRRLGLDPQTEVVLLQPVRLSGEVVHPAAIAPLDRWIPPAVARRLGPCRPADCPVVVAGRRHVSAALTANGVHFHVVGSVPLTSAVPLGFAPDGTGEPPVLVTGDVAGLESLAGLDAVYRTHTWLSPLDVSALKTWQLAPLEQRLARTQAALEAVISQFSVTAPFAGLDVARAQAHAAPNRLLLAGGGALAALGLFIVLAGGGLRRDQLIELGRLETAGARRSQSIVFVTAESAWLCAVALVVGAGLAILAATVLAHAGGEPAGGVLSHSLVTRAAAIGLLVAWMVASAIITLSVIARDARTLNVLAAAALAALAAGLVLDTGGNDRLAPLLAPLVCLAAGVIVFRLAAALLRAAERVARQGPVVARLALVGLARSPSFPSLAIAFIAISVGLGGFALAYRATLLRGAADEAANRVPLDALVGQSPDFETPLEAQSLRRWQAVVAGGTVLPVRRTSAGYLSGAASATVPALGVPAGGLPLISGWRSNDGSASLSVLARRLRTSGPVRVAGPQLPPTARWLSIDASSPALNVTVTGDLRDASGTVRQLTLGTTHGRGETLRARIPPGSWELEAIELAEPTGVEATNGHQNGENPAAATQFHARVSLGPVTASASPGGAPIRTMAITRWRAVGAAAAGTGTDMTAVFNFGTSGTPAVIRPVQPSDARPVPVLADPRTAAAAGPGGQLALTVDDLPVSARVVGTLRRFPTIPTDEGGFVVADEATLGSALDAQLPGQGGADELWVSTTHPARLRAELGTAPLAPLDTTFRGDVEHQLRSAPIARGVLGTLVAAAALAAVLAVLGLLTALLGGARDERIERDLDQQGLGPRALRADIRLRLAIASVLGVCFGLAVAVLLTRLAVASVRAGTVTTPQPPLVTIVPWAQLIASGAGAIAVLLLVGWLATRLLVGRGRHRRTGPAPVRDAGAALSEELAR